VEHGVLVRFWLIRDVSKINDEVQDLATKHHTGRANKRHNQRRYVLGLFLALTPGKKRGHTNGYVFMRATAKVMITQ